MGPSDAGGAWQDEKPGAPRPFRDDPATERCVDPRCDNADAPRWDRRGPRRLPRAEEVRRKRRRATAGGRHEE